MRKLPSRKLLAAIVAGALFIPQSGFTLGLGEIEVSSALNQKLRADIELLSATPEDAENLIVKLASRKEFSRAGLDRPYALSDLRFKSEVIDGVPYIKVSSGSPIREPFLNFLVEIDWPNGHMLREYTVLLDPPVFMTAAETSESRPSAPAATESRPAASNTVPKATTAMNVATPMSASTTPSPSVTTAQTKAAPARNFTAAPVVYQQAPANQQPINQPPGSYKIRAGDTSWSLADAMRPDQSVTVPQMMFAMLRANPESFINENINGLKRGYILRVPDADQIASISKADAQAMMKEHWALWRQYQQEQTGGQPVSAMQSDGAASEASGDELNAVDNAHLAIVSAGSGTAGSGSGTRDASEMSAQELRAELALARERVETERVEKEALQSRINALEQNVGQREGLLAIEDEELSGVQSLNADDAAQAEAMNAAANHETADTQSAEAQSDMAEDAGTVADADSDQPAADGNLATEGNADAADTETSDDATATDADAVFTDEVAASEGAEQLTDQAVDEGLTSDEITEQATPADTAISQPVIDEQAPSDPLTQLLNDPKMMAAAGGGLLLIAALIALMFKRRKSGEDDEPEATGGFADLESLADDIAGEANDDTTATYTESDDVDSETDVAATEAENIEEGETTAENEDEAARDDVIAEADVYLAYGIYQQAEDLLNQAIKDNPERIEYRYKLAESYHASKNATAFVDTATEIKSRIEDETSADWKKVLVMGQDLCPEESMFESAGDTELDELIADAPIMELDDDSTAGNTETLLDEADLNVEQQDAEALASPDLMDDTLELPEMDAEESKQDELTAAEPVEEIEFDISDTGALEETDATEDEFDLDIDTSELDIGGLEEEAAKAEGQEETSLEEAALEEETLDLGDIDLGLDDEDTADEITDEVQELGDTDLEFGLDDTASDTDVDAVAEATDTEIEEVTLDLSDEIAAESFDEAELDDAPDEDLLKADIADNVTAISSESDIETATATDQPVVEFPVAENLSTEEPAAEVKTIPAANDDSADEDDFDLSSLDDVDEVSTKLDLARAYLDMGDAEGTRGILEEVLVDGNDEQKQEANELLGKLA